MKVIVQWSAKCLHGFFLFNSCLVADDFIEHVKLDFQEQLYARLWNPFSMNISALCSWKWAQQERGHRTTKLTAMLDRSDSYLYDDCCFPFTGMSEKNWGICLNSVLGRLKTLCALWILGVKGCLSVPERGKPSLWIIWGKMVLKGYRDVFVMTDTEM